MTQDAARASGSDRIVALLVVCVLAAASVIIAGLGVAPARVGAAELLGQPRAPGDRAFIASHRGGAGTAPENTIPAVQAALDAGFDYVEVDVQRTADGRLVLMHDLTVDRTTDGHGRVDALTLAEIQALDAGSWFSRAHAGTRVPTFEEFLDVLARGRARAIVELKGEWDATTATALTDAVAARELADRTLVAGFDARDLAAVGAADDALARLVILRRLPDDVVTAVQQVGARGILVDRRAIAARPEVVDELHAADLRVAVYTLNQDAQWDAATALGVDGIVTDDPAMLSRWQRQVYAER